MSPMRSTRSVHVLFFDLTVLILFSDEYNSRSSPWNNSIQPPITSSRTGKTGPSAFGRRTPSVCEKPRSTPAQNHRKDRGFVCFNHYVVRQKTRRGRILNWKLQEFHAFNLLLNFFFAKALLTRTVLENFLSSTQHAFSGMNIKIPWQCKGSRN